LLPQWTTLREPSSYRTETESQKWYCQTYFGLASVGSRFLALTVCWLSIFITLSMKRAALPITATNRPQEKKSKCVYRTPASHPHLIWPKPDVDEEHTVYVDEAGRGPLCGPMVVTGVTLVTDLAVRPAGVRYALWRARTGDSLEDLKVVKMEEACEVELLALQDSKRTKLHERNWLYQQLHNCSEILAYVLFVPSYVIDELGMAAAWSRAVCEVAVQLQALCHGELTRMVVDGKVAPLAPAELGPSFTTEAMVKGDQHLRLLSAAGILAKVSRDTYMERRAPRYPEFTSIFQKEKGYGSKRHMQLVQAGHFTEEHRRSFNPLKDWLAKRSLDALKESTVGFS
jgi:ribonuclease HII